MWYFIQNQIFGMQWLHLLITGLLNIFGLNTETPIGGSVLFFIYDVLKISALLCVLIFIITYVQSYFPPERSRKILGRFHGFWANTIAALLGTVTPFCSCSSIPLFMGFTQAGLPLGVTFSFLISSPMVDMASLILLMSIFGWKVAVLYVFLGLVVAVAGGSLIEKLHMEDQVADFIRASEEKKKLKAAFVPVAKKMSAGIAAPVAPQPAKDSNCCCCGSAASKKQTQEDLEKGRMPRKDRITMAWDGVTSTFRKVILYIIAGVAIGALIHNWIPEVWVTTALGSKNPFGVIIAAILGIPMYADIFGTLPIAESLLAKGALLGVVVSFMMAVTTLSLPSMVMLSKAVKPKLLGIFIAICTAGIIIAGYLFNLVQPFVI